MDGVALTPAAGVLALGPYSGSRQVQFTAPANWGDEPFEEGHTRTFDAHLVVPATAFESEDFRNNGDGWQPGTGEAKGVSTANARDTGARRGYVHANNDWTAINVYKPVVVPGQIFGKTQTRPWDGGASLWDAGNQRFSAGSPVVVRSDQPSGAPHKYWDMAPGTELMTEVYALTQNVTGVQTTGLIVSDQWDTRFVVADPSRAASVTGPDGTVLTSGFILQWSRTVTGAAVLNPSNDGWITSSTPVDGAVSVRVVFDVLPTGSAAGAGKHSLFVPTKVRADLAEPEIPKITVDTMRGWCEGCTGANSIEVAVSILTMETPVLGVTVDPAGTVLDVSTYRMTYTVQPTVDALMKSADPINGTLTLSIDPCIIDLGLPADSPWQVVSQDLSLGCGDTGANSVTLTLKQDFTPADDMSNGRTRAPALVFDARYSMLAEDTGTVSAVWALDAILDAVTGDPGTQAVKLPDVQEVSGGSLITIPERSVVGQRITTSTPKVEITDPLRFQGVIESKLTGAAAAEPTETVIVLPGKGDDAAFLAELGGGYDGATESSFHGSYTLASVTIDAADSVPGTTVLCTTDANPGLDPGTSTWSATCGPDTTAIKVVQPGGANQGVSVVDFQLAPVGNEVGDVYLAWIGPVTGEGIQAERSFPAEDVVVASDITGYVYWDTSGRGEDRTDDSAGIENVRVELLDADGNIVADTLTDADGYYAFLEYHSGKYTTRIPAIGAAEGVPTTLDSVFDTSKQIDVSQTHSYLRQRLGNARTQSSTIDVPIDSVVRNVNFGFSAPDPYSDLMKAPARVDCPEDPEIACSVSWTITVKNGDAWNSPALTGGKLTDSTSKQVYDIQATTGLRVVDAVDRNGWGGYALLNDGQVYSWGYGAYGANGNGQSDLDSHNSTAQPVQGLPSDVIEVYARGVSGGFALTASSDVYSWGNGAAGANGNGSTANNLIAGKVQGLPSTVAKLVVGGSHIGTTAYAVTGEGELYAWGWGQLYAMGNGGTSHNLTAQLVQGLPAGVPVDEIVPRGERGGFALLSDGRLFSWGAWDYYANGHNVVGASLTAGPVLGFPAGVSVTKAVTRGTSGAVAIGSDGVLYSWGLGSRYGNGDDSTADNPVASPVLGFPAGVSVADVTTHTYGGFALGSDGVVYAWGQGQDGQNGNGGSADNRIAAPVQGFPAGTTITSVRYTQLGGRALTDEGEVYVWGNGENGNLGNGGFDNNYVAAPVQGLPFGIVDVMWGSPAFAIAGDGTVYSWGRDYGSGALGNGGLGHSMAAQPILGLPGDVVTVLQRFGYGGTARTADGRLYSWGGNEFAGVGNGTEWDSNLTPQPVQGLEFDSTVLAPLTEAVNGDFVTREFSLPNMAPGEELLVTLTGRVNKPSHEATGGIGLVIGNQAWESFDQTPRTAPTLPEPALPAWDPDDPTAFGKWTGNGTCTATVDWEMPGDQCDQVYASVPTTNQLLGALAGYTWWDESRDGVMDAAEPRLVGIGVALYRGENGEFIQKVGDTVTDANGFYDFRSLIPADVTDEDGYYVVFTPAANPQLSTGGTLLQPGQSWTWTAPYDQEPWFAVDRSASHDGITRNVAVVGGATTEPVNGGVVVYAADIDVQKGYVDADDVMHHSHSPALDPDNPGYTLATPVTVVSTNTGEESLDHLVFADANVSGAKVAWAACSIDGGAAIDITGGVWTGDAFAFVFDPDATLEVGKTLVCTGTLPAMSADTPVTHEDTVRIDGTGMLTGTPVSDDSTFTAPPPTDLPVPAITLEKGVAEAVAGSIDCADPVNAKDPAQCAIDPGAVTLRPAQDQTITFRITNTGDEPLLDMALDDATVTGTDEVRDIVCEWPTATVDGHLRRLLPPGGVALCTGTLTIADFGSTHENHAEVWAVGQISKRLTHDDADFAAETPERPGVALPMSGGTGITLFLVLAGLGGAAALVVLLRRRRAPRAGASGSAG